MKILLLVSLVFLSVVAMGQNIGQDSTIDTCVNELDMAKAKETKSGYLYWFIGKDDLDGRTIKLSVVRPGESTHHKPHQHPQDEFFYVLEGTAEFYLNGETRTVGANTSLYCPPMSWHSIRNAGQQELKYLVLKKYSED